MRNIIILICLLAAAALPALSAAAADSGVTEITVSDKDAGLFAPAAGSSVHAGEDAGIEFSALDGEAVSLGFKGEASGLSLSLALPGGERQGSLSAFIAGAEDGGDYILVRVYGITDSDFDLDVSYFDGEKVSGKVSFADVAFASDSYNHDRPDRVVRVEIKKKSAFASDGSLSEYDAVLCNGSFRLLRPENDSALEPLVLKVRELYTSSLSFSFEVEKEAEEAFSVTFYQLGLYCFYDYSKVSGAVIKTNPDSYSRITLTWQIFDRVSQQDGGYTVRRYAAGSSEPEEQNVFDSKFLNSLSDRKLNVGATYRYEIEAYNGISSAVPMVAYKYDAFTASTKQGNPGAVFLAAGIIFAAALVFAVLYIFKFDISAALKRARQKRKQI